MALTLCVHFYPAEFESKKEFDDVNLLFIYKYCGIFMIRRNPAVICILDSSLWTSYYLQ